MKKLILVIALLGALFLFGCATEHAVENQGIIKIGVMSPLTGDVASYGLSVEKAVELAFSDAKLSNVELVIEDTRCDGKEAVNAINKLISVDKVVAIVGELCSSATLAAAPVAEENEVVLISPASTSPKVSEAGEYIFRTVPSDALQGVFAADLIYDAGHETLAVIYSNEDYGIGFEEVMSASFESKGGSVVASEAFERGTLDLRTLLTKVKSEGPDAVFIVGNSPDSVVAALKQIQELGIDAALYGSEGLRADEILKADGSEGLVISSVSSGTTEFSKMHMEAYSEDPGPFAAQGYDAMTALARAIKDGATTGPEIKEALESMIFDGASGRISFDKMGDVSGNYDVFRVENGEFVLQE